MAGDSRRATVRLASIFVLCATFVRPGTLSGLEQENGRQSLRTHPPRMRSLDIEPLDSHTLRVIVDYEKDPRLEETLTLNLAQGLVRFSRGADGRYVGTVTLTDEQRKALVDRDRRIRELGPRAVHHEYDGRVAVGRVVVAPLNLSSLLPLSPASNLKTAELQQETLSTPPGASQTATTPPDPSPTPSAPPDASPTISIPPAYTSVGALVGDPKSVLIITDRAVVADAGRTWDPCAPSIGKKNGKWTFGYLMRNLAGTADASKFTEDWLTQWTKDQSVNGVPVPLRPRMKTDVLDKWPRVGTALDLDAAPFRLLAIVNRTDLAENLTFDTGPGSAGELRFVFDVAPQQTAGTAAGACAVKRFQVIFEYQVTASTCTEVEDWANRWIDLGKLTRGSPEFNQALEKITEDVITGTNGHLAQIRTNEIDLAESIGGQTLWEMREFALDAGALKERNVRRTPIDKLNKQEEISTWVNAHTTEVKQTLHEVTGSIAGANPQMDDQTFWDGARGAGKVEISDAAARYNFSLNTCNGCHARETCTRFNHVVPNAPGKEAGLSAFLVGGEVVPDPILCPGQKCSAAPASFCTPPIASCCSEFNDLVRRQQALDQVLICVLPNGYEPLNMDH